MFEYFVGGAVVVIVICVWKYVSSVLAEKSEALDSRFDRAWQELTALRDGHDKIKSELRDKAGRREVEIALRMTERIEALETRISSEIGGLKLRDDSFDSRLCGLEKPKKTNKTAKKGKK